MNGDQKSVQILTAEDMAALGLSGSVAGVEGGSGRQDLDRAWTRSTEVEK